MGLRINTNVISLISQRNLAASRRSLSRSLERLSSGQRINSARDDAAGLAISEGLRAQVRGIQQAVRNANDGVGFLQTAEGAVGEATNLVQRMRELAIQAANGTLSGADRSFLNNEKNQLLSEFQRIALETDFNGVRLLDGSFGTKNLQVGTAKGRTISFSIGDARTSQLGAVATKSSSYNNVDTAISANLYINSTLIDAAISDGVSYKGGTYSAIAAARAINRHDGVTGVKAFVHENRIGIDGISFGTFTGTIASGDFQINGSNVVASGVTSLTALVNAINAVSSTSGVTAEIDSTDAGLDKMFLRAQDGRNIVLQLDAATQADHIYNAFNISDNATYFVTVNDISSVSYFSLGNTAITGHVNVGRIELQSANAITTVASSQTLGITAGTYTVDTSTALYSVSLATDTAASNAIQKLDNALSQLNSIRSGLGAVQNRLDSVNSSLSITLENVASASSQIRDADIAVETSELTRAQILQQAGVSVLSQANVSTQVALALLQG